MSELKPCPFCGNSPIKYNQTGLIVCAYAMCGANPESKSKEDWNARHNEDEVMRDPKCELEAAKAEIEKLSPLVEIVSNQKQRIQQLEEANARMKDALNIIAGWNEHTATEKSNMGSWGEQRHYRNIAISAMGER